MDRSWMKADRLDPVYEKGVLEFLEYADQNLPDNNDIFYCPCVNCWNINKGTKDEILHNLYCEDLCQNYTIWMWHGEMDKKKNRVSQRHEVDEDEYMDDRLEDMFCDIGESSFKKAHIYDTLRSDKDTTLYKGCTSFTQLSVMLKLFNLKAKNGWSDKSFTEFLDLLKQVLPEDNNLPDLFYYAKKILCLMGLEYIKIHADPNDFILYRKDYENLDQCPEYGVSRYKVKDNNGDDNDNDNDNVSRKYPPAKVLQYLPIISRLKRLFANLNDVKNMRWHADERKCDGNILHVDDSLQWKKIDSLFPDFGVEPRNLRLGLATDEMNPFCNLSTNYSSWIVLLTIYNLYSWLCMKRKYMLLSMRISGPRQPVNDIDVYLSPLIEDLRLLWEEGVEVDDAYSGEKFKMCIMLFCTINDFPAYGNLARYSVKGHKAFPICESNTCYHRLEFGKKTVYLGHRKFLGPGHPYRRLQKAFNGEQEFEMARKTLTADEVYQ